MPSFDRHARVAFIVACIVLVVSGIGFRIAVYKLNVFLSKQPVQLQHQFSTIPRNLGVWRAIGQDEIVDAATLETLKTEDYLTRAYVNTEDPSVGVNLHIAYYTGIIDAVPHVPDRCMIAGGYVKGIPKNHAIALDTSSWYTDPGPPNAVTNKPYEMAVFTDQISAKAVQVRMPIGDPSFRTTVFTHPDAPDSRTIAGYLFVANGRTTAQPEMIRKLAFELTDKYAYYCKIQLTMRGPTDFTVDQFLSYVEMFLDDALPEIMRCLPDWAEVERSKPDPADPEMARSTPAVDTTATHVNFRQSSDTI